MMLFFPSTEGKIPLNNTLWMSDPWESARLFRLRWPLWESREMLEPFWDASLTAAFNAANQKPGDPGSGSV